MDDLIANFTSITGALPSQATQFLRLTDNNLEQAIQLFFEDPSLATEEPASSSSHPQPSTTGPSYTEDASGVVHIDSDDESDEHDRNLGYHPAGDEEIARRLQEEMYATAQRDEDTVRAPMARTTETLVGPAASGWDDDDIDQVIAQRRSRQRATPGMSGMAPPGIFHQRDVQSRIWEDPDAEPEDLDNNLARATGGASRRSDKAHSLAEMFRPPFEIISRLPWDQAREHGREKHKWLLVNVQDPAVFDCQVLNRDLWKDPQIKETIREHFIFLQYARPRDGAAPSLEDAYTQYYLGAARDNSDAYPHIAIVDPRTGEQLKVWSGAPVPKATEFLTELYDFLDRYSMAAGARNPVAKRKPERAPQMDIARMTEEEMLEMALQNSLAAAGGQGGTPPALTDPDALTRSDTLDKGKGKAAVVDDEEDLMDLGGDSEEGGAALGAFAQIPTNHPHIEPLQDPATTTRIQFRFARGRVVRRFNVEDQVGRLYEWLKAGPVPDVVAEEDRGRPFELVFMGRNLIGDVDSTITAAGLKNGSVHVEFVE
ncbi:UBX domain protein [Trichodelitschia bisporula]|uniref:UBX domain protein n=1 Tax=Trichodelitschia bisporula TaxID=703511 RepID=A0A6G1IAJ7_9PEZI|nr:UBX domain protein [Trichodelitschia bisporula]